MRKVSDIKSKKLLEEKELGNSRFEFKISGNDINYVCKSGFWRTKIYSTDYK